MATLTTVIEVGRAAHVVGARAGYTPRIGDRVGLIVGNTISESIADMAGVPLATQLGYKTKLVSVRTIVECVGKTIDIVVTPKIDKETVLVVPN